MVSCVGKSGRYDGYGVIDHICCFLADSRYQMVDLAMKQSMK